ncbi:jg5395, partial [Pararge aegeria aegeria]
ACEIYPSTLGRLFGLRFYSSYQPDSRLTAQSLGAWYIDVSWLTMLPPPEAAEQPSEDRLGGPAEAGDSDAAYELLVDLSASEPGIDSLLGEP